MYLRDVIRMSRNAPIESGITHGAPFNYTLLGADVNLTGSYAHVDFLPHTIPSQYQWLTVYYDTPATLEQKYTLARERGLKGVGAYTIDTMSYRLINDSHATMERAEMWAAMASFLN